MAPKDSEMAAAAAWAAALRGEAGTIAGPPVSFLYGGRPSAELMAGWRVERSSAAAPGEGFTTETATWTDPETGLVLRVEARAYADFPAVEWVAYLRNDGEADTPILEDLQALDALLPWPRDGRCLVHYSLGSLCSAMDFMPVDRDLRPRGRLRLQPGGGRSSSEVLPFLNLEGDGGGMVVAVGWTGEWAVEMTRAETGETRVRAGMDLTHLTLRPGEEIRTPRVALILWEGDRWRGQNLLRRFILRHHRPAPGGEPLVAPLCNGNWGGTPAEVHLDNIRKIVEHDLPFEYYWIDAEWFGAPWAERAGDWRPRPDLYPDGLKPISDLLHRHGRKFLLWVEPERVAPDTPWARDHADWLLDIPPEETIAWADYGDWMPTTEWVLWESHRNKLGRRDRLFSLANPEARRFLTDFLTDLIEEAAIDCFRQDSNIAQLAYWRHADEPDRQGMTEIRYVEGQYELWDELLRRHPGLIIDTCASGGRRVDLETMGRATPLWRTDYVHLAPDRTSVQCHTYGLAMWVPLNSTTAGYLNVADEYVMRSSMSSGLVAGLHGHGDAPQEPIPDDYTFERARKLLEDYLALRPYFYGDYYPLTEYSQAADAWVAYQFDRPEEGDGLVVVLKRPASPFTAAELRLRAVNPDREYTVTNLDTGDEAVCAGGDLLSRGLRVELPGTPDSAVLVYTSQT